VNMESLAGRQYILDLTSSVEYFADVGCRLLRELLRGRQRLWIDNIFYCDWTEIAECTKTHLVGSDRDIPRPSNSNKSSPATSNHVLLIQV
jgi:hypothetical protein